MSTHIDTLHGRQVVVGAGGEPQYVLVPVQEYIELMDTGGVVLNADGQVLDVPDSVTILGPVAKRVQMEDMSMLRAWREYLGMTQKQVAEHMGVSKAAYSQMERGQERLRIDTLKRIARALGVADWRKLVD